MPSFLPPAYYPFAGAGGWSMPINDFNQDGSADLVTTVWDRIVVLPGDGKGTFGDAIYSPSSGASFATAPGDFNRDGILDLAVSNASGRYRVAVLLGNGDGTFAPAEEYALPADAVHLLVSDLNGDKLQDLALTISGQGVVSVLLGHGDGTFQQPVHYPTNRGYHQDLGRGDFNGDGREDLVTVDSKSRTVILFYGNGDGTFQAPRYVSTAGIIRPWGVEVRDFDRDGRADLALVTANDDIGVILLGNGDGTFRLRTTFDTAGTGDLIAEDFNADGFLDVAWAKGRWAWRRAT